LKKHGKPVKGSGDPSAGLPECPNTEDDDPTINGAAPVPYPRPNANCRTVDDGLVQLKHRKRAAPGADKGTAGADLPECPMPEDDSPVEPIVYPKPGATCVKRDDSLVQKKR
jgi:hypothetical protein